MLKTRRARDRELKNKTCFHYSVCVFYINIHHFFASLSLSVKV